MVPPGTPLIIQVLQPLSSHSARLGDVFEARIVSDIKVEGERVVPSGTRVDGRCVAVRDGDADGRSGYLRVALTGLRDSQGRVAPLETTTVSEWGSAHAESRVPPSNDSGDLAAPADREEATPPSVEPHASEAEVQPGALLTFVLLRPAFVEGPERQP